MEIMTTAQTDSFLDVLFIGLVFLAILAFFERRRAKKKNRTAFFGKHRLLYAVIGVTAFAFFQGVDAHFGWIIMDAYLLKCMWDDYKFDRQIKRWHQERELEAQQMRNS